MKNLKTILIALFMLNIFPLASLFAWNEKYNSDNIIVGLFTNYGPYIATWILQIIILFIAYIGYKCANFLSESL